MRYRPFIASIAGLLLCSVAAAQPQPDVQRFERQLEQIRRDTRLLANPSVPLGQRSYFDYGAYFTFNYLSFDDPELHNRGLRQYDLTAYTRINLDNTHEIFFRGRAFYRDFNDGDSFDTEVNGWDGRIERLYYQFDLAQFLAGTKGTTPDGNIRVKVGRDLVFWGNGLTFTSELDGAVVDLEYGPMTLELLAGRTPSDTVDIDSSRPNFDDHTNRAFYGAMLSTRVGMHRPYAYVLVQRDHNSDDTSTTTIGGTDVTTEFEYNSQYFGIGSQGALTDRLVYGVELVFEAGRGYSNSFAIDSSTGAVSDVDQQKDDIHAWAFDAQIDYLFPDTRKTRLSGEITVATGDSDRLTATSTFGGNLPGSKDYGYSGFGLINTGLAFAPSVSNLIALRGGASTFPFPDIKHLRRMQVGTDLFLFMKCDPDAPIDELTTDDRMLGFEPDFYLNWQLTSDLTLALRYGLFVPGDAIVADDKIRQFFYAGVTFAF